jgi:hypothetical protein
MKYQRLNDQAFKGLVKVGDIYIGDAPNMPKFSQLSIRNELQRMTDFIHPMDFKDLELFLSALSFLPMFIIHFILKFFSSNQNYPGFLKKNCILIDTALKGITRTIYYSDIDPRFKIHSKIGFHSKINEIINDEEMESLIKKLDFNHLIDQKQAQVNHSPLEKNLKIEEY